MLPRRQTFTDWTEEAIEKAESNGERAFEQESDRKADELKRHMEHCPTCKVVPFGGCHVATAIFTRVR